MKMLNLSLLKPLKHAEATEACGIMRKLLKPLKHAEATEAC